MFIFNHILNKLHQGSGILYYTVILNWNEFNYFKRVPMGLV